MMAYQWVRGSRLSGDAQVVGEELDRIAAEHGGSLTPEVVLDAARPEGALLHDRGGFEWRDEAAAEAHRLNQARYLIRSIQIVVSHPEPQAIRAYVAVRQEEPELPEAPATASTIYVPTETALKEPVLRDQVLHQAYSELQQWANRYRRFKEFGQLLDAIDAAGQDFGLQE